MRKLFPVICLFSMLFAFACETESKNDEKNGSTMTFTFSNLNVTETSVEFTVTPSDFEANYLLAVVPATDVADKSDAEVISSLLQSASTSLRKGTQIYGARDLNPDTEYVACAFAYGATDVVSRYSMRTLADSSPVPSEQFDVEIEVSNITATSATAVARPNTTANRYYFRVITKMELTALGIYENDYEIFDYIISNPLSGDYVTQGTTTRQCELHPEMEYLAVAFNYENWDMVYGGREELRLFRYAFETPEAAPIDPSTLFTTSNLQVSHQGFTLDVTPTKGEDSFWCYYIWTKDSYDTTYNNEAKGNIVMRSYWGLANLGHEQGFTFAEFIQQYMGQEGTSTILNYEPLKNDTEYVVVLFYMDPEVTDQTVVYDYNYVAVPFKTLPPTDGAEAALIVSEPTIVAEGTGTYKVIFNVKTNENAVDLKYGAQMWSAFDFERYWDPNDWTQVQAFFMFRTSVEKDTLAAAKTPQGADISITGITPDEYAFFFEALNAEGTPTQFGYHLTVDQFPN